MDRGEEEGWHAVQRERNAWLGRCYNEEIQGTLLGLVAERELRVYVAVPVNIEGRAAGDAVRGAGGAGSRLAPRLEDRFKLSEEDLRDLATGWSEAISSEALSTTAALCDLRLNRRPLVRASRRWLPRFDLLNLITFIQK